MRLDRTLPVHGRGAPANPAGRFEAWQAEVFDDGWTPEEVSPPKTEVREEHGSSAVSYNESPDVGFDRSVNPYRGCEHGCAYCYARPSHAYLGLSPGLDFETRLTAKVDIARLLADELRKPGYRPGVVAIGPNTDCYQPIERHYRLTRQVIETLLAFGHPFGIITKSALVLRDRDLLAEAARRRLVHVHVSVTTLDRGLARQIEPRAPTPERRLQAIAGLTEAGVPVSVLAAPMIPGLTEPELEGILEAARDAGARRAGYVLLRLPREVAGLFRGWLEQRVPGRAQHVMGLVQQMRGGDDNDTRFGQRMRGQGPLADLLARRFEVAARRLGLDGEDLPLDLTQFRPPPRSGDQLDLFGR
jgi:DNA repair photolyase